MYSSLSNVFKKPVPTAEVYPPSVPQVESDFYFQLLSDYGIQLNEPQKAAVKAVEGPVLVIAGAGSGKTTVLTSRIGYMIHTKNIDPSRILLVTYTTKASLDMIERLSRIPGINRTASRSVIGGTYHSICLKILRSEGYSFTVLSSERKKQIMIKTILKRIGRQDDYTAEAVLNVISSWKNSMKRPEDIDAETEMKKELITVYAKYEELKEKDNLFDFDDMLLEVYKIFKFSPEILAKYQEKFQYILCDEFQDSCSVQYEIIKMLASPSNNLCIVGDDSQTIYGFRSASASYMINFHKVYPDCTRIIMDINYRSGPSVVGLANAIIHNNKKQIKKTLKVANAENHEVQFSHPQTSDEEADEIVKDILKKQAAGMELRDMAVLYRTHAIGRAIFEKLLMADIPFVTYQKSNETFYKNTFIRPLLALLKLSHNYSDTDSMIEAAPILYISRSEMGQVIEEVSYSYGEETPKDLLGLVMKRIADRKNGFQQKRLMAKLGAIQSLKKMTAPQAIREIRKGTIDYEKQLELDERKRLTISSEIIYETLDECEQAARGFSTPKAFLNFIQRVEEKNEEMEELRMQPDIEAVRLMTIHTSKGLEFEQVYAIGWAEGILPHVSSLDMEQKADSHSSPEELLEEERRLAYVCLTRAKKYLSISSPKMHRDQQVQISRFLEEGLNMNTREVIAHV
ncbi:ATP-dependent helicase [Cytobacillus gottheilii]|uniref:ATP-dependent helicase n=1 Tax=Cytobacillus gottheilii TaxID=859144 RepID=UPI002495457C|nr:ATP-dependent helicase [Cytobacillus gottheilii]